MALIILLLALELLFPQAGAVYRICDTTHDQYQCLQSIANYWGTYAPFFSVPTNISASVPHQCRVTFAQVLSRHGGRFPTPRRSAEYRTLIKKIHTSVPHDHFTGQYAFLANYSYTLGAGDLTAFGEREMFSSGLHFYHRYSHLTATSTPFIRSTYKPRVLDSAKAFSSGFHTARRTSQDSPDTGYPYPIFLIDVKNNTLRHGQCQEFENSRTARGGGGEDAKKKWGHIFLPPIQKRLRERLPGVEFSLQDALRLMDLCPFNTVASANGSQSGFCQLFTQQEWEQYDYFMTLGKYYAYGEGNYLGPTQGVGWVGELLARLTGDRYYVRDGLYTSVNHTLDNDQKTFPLGPDYPLYADFSHDNDMTSIMAALGLYNTNVTGGLLPKTGLRPPMSVGGYSASWTVPFAARVYIEKMVCQNRPEAQLVRILVNDRVVPLQNCGADELGRCSLGAFVESLEFARTGGRWAEC
ncbi:MAG: hypothetical protein M1821_005852 [Bathelium mastoideum]|nr:MAG: hypothetical protein M1821_005852 [Bathelium mastoideum]